MHYIDLLNKKVFKDCGQFRYYLGSFENAKDLQVLLNDIAIFSGFKKPRRFIAVIKKFERETNLKCIY